MKYKDGTLLRNWVIIRLLRVVISMDCEASGCVVTRCLYIENASDEKGCEGSNEENSHNVIYLRDWCISKNPFKGIQLIFLLD